ncbi:NAD-dependent epimerase/dehydratase family protein [Rubrimonas cliftonensis]|uniref:Nucleoside-diphosphate-sugar epimerase n=1 Tax=Rubrimonas cliftonensis TaxID=89524 RepID=A0A1H4G724_9RHOB|nr:NAD(P)-dependent oxidoreductase [Rubrimonas cliftonensis]SEB05354.1 Nucleoside-diphosphate-sugar epimerase [Rubrimonas cliftonensis]
MLVTGAGGFVGRALTSALRARGVEVLTAEGLLGRRGDLLDASERRSLITAAHADTLIHLAWTTGHGAFWTCPSNDAWSNASAELFRAFYARGGRRVVGVGTCAEYDWTAADAPLREDAPLRPHTAYGAAKARAAEALLDAATRAGAEAAWARAFLLLGAGEPAQRLVPAMIDAALSGGRIDCGPGGTERDLWSVETLGLALADLSLSTLSGAINLASGRRTRFDALAGMIERACGTSGAIRCGARPLRAGEPARLVADAGRMRRELGFRDPGSLEGAIADYVATRRAEITAV